MKRLWYVLILLQSLHAGASPNAEVYRLLNILSDSFRYIRADYVTPVSDESLIEAAIQGMLSSLDPYSGYINQERYQDILKDLKGGYAGIGIEFTLDHDKLKIITPLDGSPASEAGLKPGDTILAINKEPVQGLNLFEISDRLKGHAQEPITLKIQRGEEKSFVVQLKRRKIVLNPVSWKIYNNKGYIRLSNFNHTKTAQLFKKAVLTLQGKVKGRLEGVILDLRNNPGGVLDQAINIADQLIDKGLIVSVKERKSENDKSYNATSQTKILKNIPLVVLVNNGTASSAEILAAALKDHNRAFLMGSKTYGKGSIQTILPIPPGYTAIRLTTGYYYSPSGQSIQGKGIEPHEILPNTLTEDQVIKQALHTLSSLKTPAS